MGNSYSFTPKPVTVAAGGSTILITGGNNGLGFEMAKQIAEAGAFANVVIASRNLERGETAAQKIRETAKKTVQVDVLKVDVSDMDAVRGAAKVFSEKYDRLDVLCNNAGIMAPPELTAVQTKKEDSSDNKSFQKCDSQMTTNFVGHFLLTKELFPLLVKGNGRVVNLSSIAHKGATQEYLDITFNDPGFQSPKTEKYNPQKSYSSSKIAANYFTRAFNEHAMEAGLSNTVDAVTAHPGVSDSDLFGNFLPAWILRPTAFVFRAVGAISSVQEGAQSQIRAACDREFVKAGNFIGPSGCFGEWTGTPKIAKESELAQNKDNAMRLWETAERLVGEEFKMTK